MKILMFGWEFPPHITGGLGTACLGLSKSLSEMNDIDLIMVVPKANHQSNENFKLISADKIAIEELLEHKELPFKYFEIDANLLPYCSPEEFDLLQNSNQNTNTKFIETNQQGELQFHNNYDHDIFNEVLKYTVVAHDLAKENDFDLIHVHDWMSFPAGMEAKENSGKPLIAHIHSTEFDRNRNNINPAIYSIEKEGLEAADKVIAVSEHSKQVLVEKYEIEPEKVEVVYNGIEFEQIHDPIKKHKQFEESLISFVGRITSQKGPEYFIKAAYEILKTNRNYRFVMAGDGNLKQKMVELVAKLGISDRFHFTGFLNRNEIRQLFSISDAYVLSSVSEPFGITVLEAISAQVPVIVSNQAGVTEVIQNTIKIDYWNTEALVNSILKITSNKKQTHAMSIEARKELNALSWKKAAIQLHNLYQETIKPE